MLRSYTAWMVLSAAGMLLGCSAGAGTANPVAAPTPSAPASIPAPSLTSIQPAGAASGAGDTAVTFNGTNLVPGVVVVFGSVALQTTYVSSSSATAIIPAGALQAAGDLKLSLQVGASSYPSALSFSVTNPAPVLSSVTPSTLIAGSQPGLLVVAGDKLLPITTANLGGKTRVTHFLDRNHLAVELTADDLQSAQILPLVLSNPLPGGGSVMAQIEVDNPKPTLTNVSPVSLLVGQDGQVVLTGTGFLPGTAVQIDGSSHAVTLTDNQHLSLVLRANELSQAKIASIAVINPAPGGGSATEQIEIGNPKPTIANVSPASLRVGEAAQITLTGTGFLPGSVLQIDGSSHPANVTDSQHVTFALRSGERPQAEIASLSVINPAPGGGASQGTTGLTISNPAPVLQVLSTTSFRAGALASSIEVTASGLLLGFSATVDGQLRDVVVSADSHVSVSVKAEDLLFATTRAVRFINPGPGDASSNPLPFTVHNLPKPAEHYVAFGDSNTSGFGPAGPAGLAYPNLLTSVNGLTLDANMAGFGIQSCDIFPAQMFPNGFGNLPVNHAVYTLMVGENDLLQWGVGSHEASFNQCEQAVVSWLALPSSAKVWAGNPAGLVTSGACSILPDQLNTMRCSAAGTISEVLATYGHPIYLWYLVDDAASANASFTVQVDGVTQLAATTVPQAAVKTGLGQTRSIALARIPVPSGPHSVKVSTLTGDVGILGFATPPATPDDLPFVVVGDILNSLAGSNQVSAAGRAQYTNDVQANIGLLRADGLDIRYAMTGAFVTGATEEMSDTLHLSVLGHQHLQQAFQTGFADLTH